MRTHHLGFIFRLVSPFSGETWSPWIAWIPWQTRLQGMWWEYSTDQRNSSPQSTRSEIRANCRCSISWSRAIQQRNVCQPSNMHSSRTVFVLAIYTPFSVKLLRLCVCTCVFIDSHCDNLTFYPCMCNHHPLISKLANICLFKICWFAELPLLTQAQTPADTYCTLAITFIGSLSGTVTCWTHQLSSLLKLFQTLFNSLAFLAL